jgi:Holliday junction DNA helicase RuvA
MIARLSGILAEKSKERVIVDVQGVGYGLLVPDTVLVQLPEAGADVILEVYTHVREDLLQLYGFATRLEKDTFEILLGANGIGPKLALTILSALSAEQVLEAVVRGDKDVLVAIPGVGKKTVERILLEIKEKCEKRLFAQRSGGVKMTAATRGNLMAELSAASSLSWSKDLEEALRALGYRDQDLTLVLKEVYDHVPVLGSFEIALKFSLQRLGNLTSRSTLRGNA